MNSLFRRAKGSTFDAIGVTQGDAFLLQRKHVTALIDGGGSTNGFSNHFERVAKRESVDILVCTHNDADHARGVLGFLLDGLRCEEVWLPGSWTDRLEDILLRAEEFTEKLISDIEKIEITPDRSLALQALGDQYSEQSENQERNIEGTTSTDALSEALEIATETKAPGDIFWSYLSPWSPEDWLWLLYGLWRRDRGRFQLCVEAISAAARIREISLAAYNSGALIRWFEYDSALNAGGNQDFLVPLNAREVFQIRRRRGSALEYLGLTTSNKQSLVFISPANGDEPPVLFTADSDLSFSQPVPWSDGMVITAPHHGSEDNAKAYKRFIKETSNNLHVVWVRSDGRFKARPGNSYLNAYGERFCTLCRGSILRKQNVRLMAAGRKWQPIETRSCCCK